MYQQIPLSPLSKDLYFERPMVIEEDNILLSLGLFIFEYEHYFTALIVFALSFIIIHQIYVNIKLVNDNRRLKSIVTNKSKDLIDLISILNNHKVFDISFTERVSMFLDKYDETILDTNPQFDL